MTPAYRGATARLFILAGLLLAGAAANRATTVAEQVPPREPLRQFPMRIADWSGEAGPDFDRRVVESLGTNEYISRVYQRPSALPVDLYVGYYETQRTGSLIHSPLNCLPGSGWQPVESEQMNVRVFETDLGPASPARDLRINRLVVQKAGERHVVFYWYQGRGRVTASEYRNRLYLALDALVRHRTDGALVRVMSPMLDDGGQADPPDVEIRKFVQAAFRAMERYIPV